MTAGAIVSAALDRLRLGTSGCIAPQTIPGRA
jgi:hypothetical protein